MDNKVMIHIFNRYDELRGGYLSPLFQSEKYKTYKPIFFYTHRNKISKLTQEKNIECIIDSEIEYEYIFNSIKRKRINLKTINMYLKQSKKLIDIFRKNNIKIVHTQNFESSILVLLAAKISRVKIITHIRGDGNFYKFRHIIKNSDKIIAVSNGVKNSIKKQIRGIESNSFIQVIHNGAEIPKNHKYMEERDITRIALIGSIYSVKGQLEFIRDIWKYIDKMYKNKIELYIIGSISDDEYMKQIMNIIEKEGYKNIIFTGMQENMEYWYRYIDICVIYSKSEGFPRVGLEAMSYGIPVVGTDICGNNELIISGYNGYLIDHKNIEDNVKILKKIIDNREHRIYIGSNAKQHIKSNYSMDLSSDKIEKLYSGMLKN